MPAFKFKGVDFIELDSLLSDDEKLVRDNTRKFVEENIIPIIEQCNRDGRFPRETGAPIPAKALQPCRESSRRLGSMPRSRSSSGLLSPGGT